jgi:ABC-type multidrug transport system fused ATPase/permease subunit
MRRRRHGRGGDGADAAAERDDRVDHVGGVEFLPIPRRRGRRDGDDHRADHLTDAPGAKPLAFDRGEIVFDGVSHHYGRGAGGLDRISLTIRPARRSA